MSIFHFHKWKLIGAKSFKSTQYGYWMGGTFQAYPTPIAQDKTMLLYRCPCERYRTHEIDGIWGMDQLRGSGE